MTLDLPDLLIEPIVRAALSEDLGRAGVAVGRAGARYLAGDVAAATRYGITP